MSNLIERLRMKARSGQYAPGGGSVTSDGKALTWGGESLRVLVNPDGPEAAAYIEQLEAKCDRLERMVDALMAAVGYAHSEGFEWPSDPLAAITQEGQGE